MPASPRRYDENTPPTPKSKVRGGILQGASRRRRARSAGGPHHPRYAVGQAKHKSTVKNQSVNLRVSPSTDVPPDPSIFLSNLNFPRYLSRPAFHHIAKETVASIAPELADTELNYIRLGLECLGPRMLQVLAGVKAEPPPNVLPMALDVVVNDISSDMPTHMLAVYSRNAPPATKRRVTLFPTHNIILATHCANLPLLPKSNVAPPDAAGSTVSLPMVPLCIPAPDLFPHLTTFLYTKRIDHLLHYLLPCPVPPALYRDDPKSDAVIDQLQQFSDKLATGYATQTLLARTMMVNGLWRNACALGIDDAKLWCALDVAWEVLIKALAVSTGRRL